MNNQSGDQKAWIGLFRDSWEWSDNSTSSFRNWDTEELNQQCTTDKPDKQCTKVNVRAQNGNWTDEKCDKSLPFVCHKDQMFLIRENRTWTEALEYCRMKQMDLVSVYSEEIQLHVMNVIKNASTSEVWMGLRHSCALGIWFWLTGEMMCYQKWAPGNGTQAHDCSHGRVGAIQSGEDHRWISLNETHKLNFICTKANV
ncbi:secretory phospholipase A2 receptor-like [Misgurnus anguillicaudatus]|uniref:secretory phospholipase A2 receptor-like n=1 Tax=Misgurnus anguillicaudatus TaxID=75329 RepID=UPI003CCEFD0F